MEVTWAAAAKWAVRDGGDAVFVAQPRRDHLLGVLIDVQGSSPGGSRLAWSLVPFALQLAAEGADSELVARGLNRALCVRRGGAVQASLGVVLISPASIVTAAAFGNVLVHQHHLPAPTAATRQAAGLDMEALPVLGRFDVGDGPIVMCSDGVADSAAGLDDLMAAGGGHDITASGILGLSVKRDGGRPRGDMAVIVVADAPSAREHERVAGAVTFAPVPSRKGSIS